VCDDRAALTTVIECGDVHLVQSVCDHLPGLASAERRQPFLVATYKGQLDIMKLLLYNLTIDTKLQDAGGRSALEVAL
jgi:hypothetical protein